MDGLPRQGLYSNEIWVSDFGIYEVLAGQTGEWTTVLSPLSIDFLNCIVGIPAKYQLMTLDTDELKFDYSPMVKEKFIFL